jgi:hypothetical protein
MKNYSVRVDTLAYVDAWTTVKAESVAAAQMVVAGKLDSLDFHIVETSYYPSVVEIVVHET